MTATAPPPRAPDPRGGAVGRWLWPERFRPWQGRATRADLALTGAFLAVVMVGVAARPVKPFLIASHPVALQLLTGDLLATGAAAAFARVGEAPLWIVIVAGSIGMAKFDWLVWWAGRRWGEGMIRMVASPHQARRYAVRAANLEPWIVRVAVVMAVLPGVPAPIVYALAGITGMRLVTFLILDLAGAVLVTSLVAGLGYTLGQDAVDLVLVIDRYASVVSLTVLALAFLVPWLRRRAISRVRGRSATGAGSPSAASSRWTSSARCTGAPAGRRGRAGRTPAARRS